MIRTDGVRTTLRLVAVAIAGAGMVDPAVTRPRPVPLTVAIHANEPHSPVAARVKAELARALGDRIRLDAAADPSQLIVVGRPTDAIHVDDGVGVSTVSLSGAPSPNVWIDSIAAPEQVHASLAATLVAGIRARGMSGRTSTIVLEQQHVQLAHVEHRWRSDDERFAASFEYAPPATGLAELRIVVRGFDGEANPADNATDLGVLVDARRLRVLTYEPRPSWATGFVRLALERDPAFEVASSARPSRGIDVTGGEPVALRRTALERFDAVVVGAPEELTAADVEALDAFARVRGGAVVVLPDRRPAGPFLSLLPATAFEEVLLERPVALQLHGSGGLRASEFVLPRNEGPGAVPLATIFPRQRTAISWWPLGAGRVLFSGALDAWRYRGDEGEGFARFWRATVAAAALAAPPRIAVTLEPRVAAPGGAIRIIARVRRTEFDAAAMRGGFPSLGAELIAEDGSREPIRLWPTSDTGVFEGTARPTHGGRYSVRVTSEGTTTDAVLVVREGAVQPSPDDRDLLAALVAATGGRAAELTNLSPIVDHLNHADRPRIAVALYPMRSPWWILPFTLALCGEWALRRRGGLR